MDRLFTYCTYLFISSFELPAQWLRNNPGEIPGEPIKLPENSNHYLPIKLIKVSYRFFCPLNLEQICLGPLREKFFWMVFLNVLLVSF